MEVAGTGTPKIISRTVPAAADTVFITAVDAATGDDGVVSPVTEHTISAFKVAAVPSVIWRVATEKVVVATGALVVALVQAAVGEPVNDGKPVTEIKATVLTASVPVKLTVKVVATCPTLLLNAIEATLKAGRGTPRIISRTVPAAADTVFITAVDAAAGDEGVVSPVTEHTIAAFKVAAVPSVIWRRPYSAE